MSRIAELICELDGEQRTGIAISEGERNIVVGGGNDGKVIAYWTENNTDFYTLVGDPEAQGTTVLFAYGQPGDYDNRNIVEKAVAAQAVKDLLTGKSTGFTWEKE